MSAGRFSDFIVYVDESGDHGMQTIDQNYPVFVLAFCVFYKSHYAGKVMSTLGRFKFNHFGHDHVVPMSTRSARRPAVCLSTASRRLNLSAN